MRQLDKSLTHKPPLLVSCAMLGSIASFGYLTISALLMIFSTAFHVIAATLLMGLSHGTCTGAYWLAIRQYPNGLNKIRATSLANLILSLIVIYAEIVLVRATKLPQENMSQTAPESFTSLVLYLMLLAFPLLALYTAFSPAIRDYLHLINIYDGDPEP